MTTREVDTLKRELAALDVSDRLADIEGTAVLVWIVTRWNPAMYAADQAANLKRHGVARPPAKGTPRKAWDKKLRVLPATRTYSMPVAAPDEDPDELARWRPTLRSRITDEDFVPLEDDEPTAPMPKGERPDDW